MRAHLLRTLCDYEGNVLYNARVRIFEASTYDVDGNLVPGTALAATLYDGPDPAHSASAPTTQIVTEGTLSLWLDLPQYVRLGVTPFGSTSEHFIEGVPVLVPVAEGGGGGGGGGGALAPITTGLAKFTSVEGNDFNDHTNIGTKTWTLTERVQTEDQVGLPTWLSQAFGSIVLTPGVYSFEVHVELAFVNPGEAPVTVDLVLPAIDAGGQGVLLRMTPSPVYFRDSFDEPTTECANVVSYRGSVPPMACQEAQFDLRWPTDGSSSETVSDLRGDPAFMNVHITRWRDAVVLSGGGT